MKQSQAEVQKRLQQLLELFETEGSLQVSDVSKLFNMSELTIRRDFNVLEKKGYIERFHGGAKLISAAIEKAPVFETKEPMHQNQKHRIAKVVSNFINEKDIVFFNAGTTTLEVIRCVKDKDITIVTNNALAISALGDGLATLISTGGEYNKRNQSYTGALATNLINKVYSTVCVLGVNGIHHNSGITTSAYLETMINEELLKRCKGKKIVAADGSKVGRIFCYTSAAITDIDILVTDSSADQEELESIRKLGIQIILADQADY